MAKFYLLKIRMSIIDIFSTELYKFTFDLDYMLLDGDSTEDKKIS